MGKRRRKKKGEKPPEAKPAAPEAVPEVKLEEVFAADKPPAPKKAAEKKEKAAPAEKQPAAARKAAEKAPAEPVEGKGASMKTLAVALLFVLVLALAYSILSQPGFVPGTEVDQETFKDIFIGSEKVFIVMDVRGARDSTTSNNVLQCGVDFAASSGMGGKDVMPFSFGMDGCVAADGPHTVKECFDMMQGGVTIYVRDGPGGAKYYTNGMVVSVGSDYSVGTCGISWN